jgi:integrase/recombinase XerD
MTLAVALNLERGVARFRRWLQYTNKSANTINVYGGATEKFGAWLVGEGVNDWRQVTGDHVQGFIISILETRSAGYANNLYRALQQFWRWYAEEYETVSPMAKLKPPMLPEQEPTVLREDELRALLKNVTGREFIQRRDSAILYLFLDSGLRRAELAALSVGDVDLDHRECTVVGKGRRARTARVRRCRPEMGSS